MPPRPPKGSSISANQHAYIPQGAQQALARQMQQSVPQHLKQYVNNPNGYVPPRVQQELTTYMESALPQHLQQYAGAYVEQNVVIPSMMQRPGGAVPDAATFRPKKAINPRNLSHSGAVGSEQADATRMLELFQPEHQRSTKPAAATGGPASSLPAPTPETAAEPKPERPVLDPDTPPQYPAGQLSQPYHTEEGDIAPPDPSHYDFIVNPAARPKPVSSGSGSLFTRIAVVAGLGVVLLIAVIVVSSLLKGGNGSQTALLSVAQEQTELLRVAAQAAGHTSQQTTLELANATTINVTSAQEKTLSYFASTKFKYDSKSLVLKHSAQTDSALNSAIANSTFDKTFQQLIQQDLTSYSSALQRAYNANPGPRGRALLKSQYDGATLLLEQSKQF